MPRFLSRRRARIDPIFFEGSLRRANRSSITATPSPHHLLLRSPSSKAILCPKAEDEDEEDEADEDEDAAFDDKPSAAIERARQAATVAANKMAAVAPATTEATEAAASPPVMHRRRSSLSRAPVREPPPELWAAFTHEGGAGHLDKENQDSSLAMQVGADLVVFAVFDGQ